MATETCNACGEEVPIGGGIAGIWSSDPEGTGGLIVEFEDGTELFLCFDCIEKLPPEPMPADVDELSDQ